LNSPFTAEPLEAFMAAQVAVGVALTAIALHKPASRVSAAFFTLAIWLAVVAPMEGNVLRGVGIHLATAGNERMVYVLRWATVLAGIGALFTRRLGAIVVGVIGGALVFWVAGKITESDWDVAAFHIAFFGLLIGVAKRARTVATGVASRSPSLVYEIDDLVFFGVAVILATIVCFVVLHAETDSADEWSYTYQAAIFARGRAYAEAPPCWYAFQNFWVFEASGRNFSQYTPGWPLFMAPFFLLRVVWLAAPVSLGLFVVGVARLARRAAAGFSRGTTPPSASQVRAAGWFAALATMLSATMLINGGSRFPHIFVGATFAWAVEWLCAMTSGDLPRDRQWKLGLACGAVAMITTATRPPDGLTLGIGMLAYAAYALAKGKLPWRALAGTLVSFAVVAGFTLVVLRLQLGKWFATGYSLNDVFHPWNHFGYSVPDWKDLKAALPFATGSYCWLPCSPAIGLAGFALMHGSARRIAVILFVSSLAFVGFYEAIEFGRHLNFGYGPRFQLPLVVPMAVGTGVAMANLWSTARLRHGALRAIQAGGPLAAAIAAALVGVGRIAPLLYPFAHQSVMTHDALHEALEAAHLKNALVYVTRLNNTDVRDMTENLPLDLYPDQDVVVAIDVSPNLHRCVENAYPRREPYRAVGMPIHFERIR